MLSVIRLGWVGWKLGGVEFIMLAPMLALPDQKVGILGMLGAERGRSASWCPNWSVFEHFEGSKASFGSRLSAYDCGAYSTAQKSCCASELASLCPGAVRWCTAPTTPSPRWVALAVFWHPKCCRMDQELGPNGREKSIGMVMAIHPSGPVQASGAQRSPVEPVEHAIRAVGLWPDG